MNYRHGFHAGNFADVLKHLALVRALIALTKKDAPLRYIDTHAGAGRYDLTNDIAGRSPEWRYGIGRVLGASRASDIQALLEPYLALMPGHLPGEILTAYPGSPAIAQALLRRQDAIALCDLNPDEASALTANLRKDARLRIAVVDGYVALNAYVPPKERRGLVLIDPPFEAEQERRRLVDALTKAVRKWPQGCYLVWRPIKDRQEDQAFLEEIKSLGRPNVLNLELDVGRAAPPAPQLRRTGLIVVNPPYGLAGELEKLLAYLTPLLARGDGAASLCDWLTPPT